MSQKLAANGQRLANCRDGGCYPALARVLGVNYLVAARVSESNKNYEISLEIINGRTGGVIGTNRERCEICGVDEAGEKMALAATALRARLEALVTAPARFIIRSRPAGVAITIDGAPAGHTPIDRELAGGPHKLELAAPGYDSLDRTVTVVAGVDETIDLELVPIPMKFPFRKAGWAALVVGVAARRGRDLGGDRRRQRDLVHERDARREQALPDDPRQPRAGRGADRRRRRCRHAGGRLDLHRRWRRPASARRRSAPMRATRAAARSRSAARSDRIPVPSPV